MFYFILFYIILSYLSYFSHFILFIELQALNFNQEEILQRYLYFIINISLIFIDIIYIYNEL